MLQQELVLAATDAVMAGPRARSGRGRSGSGGSGDIRASAELATVLGMLTLTTHRRASRPYGMHLSPVFAAGSHADYRSSARCE